MEITTKCVQAKDFRKQINTIPVERMIETRGLSEQQKQYFADKELYERSKRRSDAEIPALLQEIEEERKKIAKEEVEKSRIIRQKIEKMRIAKEAQMLNRQKIKKIMFKKLKIFAGASLIIGATALISKSCSFYSDPSYIAAFDMVVNSNGYLVTNDEKISAQKFNVFEDEELLSFLVDNSVTDLELVDSIEDVCDEYDLNQETILENVKNEYSNIFDEISNVKSK